MWCVVASGRGPLSTSLQHDSPSCLCPMGERVVWGENSAVSITLVTRYQSSWCQVKDKLQCFSAPFFQGVTGGHPKVWYLSSTLLSQFPKLVTILLISLPKPTYTRSLLLLVSTSFF